MLSSCNIAAMVAYVGSPDPQQEAIYTLPNVPTVVFVDDRRNVMHPVRLRRVIAEQVTNELLAKNAQFKQLFELYIAAVAESTTN